ncbi:MAG: hypothetical protein PHV23_01440 [Candidatus Gracilibacteria bacterium]|nr:hypothetical protein [Candidatus Gracilibacteria bacterium]
MSLTIDLIIKKKISYNLLVKTIKDFGFRKNGRETYFFYEEKDFLSFSSIELYIHFSDNNTEIHTRTSGLRYSYDIEKQKEIIKILKNKFGGYIKNDWPLNSWKDVNYSAIERACGLSYHKFQMSKMRVLRMIHGLKDDIDDEEYFYFISLMDPSSNYINLIIPFLISSLEDFLKTFFIRYLNYSKISKLDNENKIDKRLSYNELIKISNGDLTLGELISEKYNFQNIKNINEAYKEFTGYKFTDIINKKRKVESGKFYNLKNELNRIIELRHTIIHEAEYIHITKKELIDIYDVVFKCGEEFVKYIEEKENIKLDLNK